MQNISKRTFIQKASALGVGSFGVSAVGVGFGALSACAPQDNRAHSNSAATKSEPFRLKNITGDAQPIRIAERQARIAKAQRLMQEQGIGALVIESGSALIYFTGVRWRRSERFTGAIITANGGFTVITPYFEEPTIRERMSFGDDVRTWHEDESPFKLITDYLRENNALDKPLAIEETTRQFIITGIHAQNTAIKLVSGQSVTRGCRMFKSPAEIALMQKANDVTMAAYRHIYPRIELGMTRHDISAMMSEATRQLGAQVQFSLVLLGPSSSFPHGSDIEYKVEDGQIILMDCGASLYDYESDISRTWVMGEANAAQRKVWDTVKHGQELALETIQIGTPAGRVDAVVRDYYTQQGYGPDYAAPGLTHRLGHGIGMDGHEPINFVRNETTPLAAGMCFSNEPGIYIPGEYGVRLEDCLYMTDNGPKLFSPLSKSIDNPFGI